MSEKCRKNKTLPLFFFPQAFYFVKTPGDFTKVAPKTTVLEEFKKSVIVRIMNKLQKYNAIFKGSGKSSLNSSPDWLKDVTFEINSLILAETNKQEIDIVFCYEKANPHCKQPQVWYQGIFLLVTNGC